MVNEFKIEYLLLLVVFVFFDCLVKKCGNGYLFVNGVGVDLSEEFWYNDDYIVIVYMGGYKGNCVFVVVVFMLSEFEDEFLYLFIE